MARARRGTTRRWTRGAAQPRRAATGIVTTTPRSGGSSPAAASHGASDGACREAPHRAVGRRPCTSHRPGDRLAMAQSSGSPSARSAPAIRDQSPSATGPASAVPAAILVVEDEAVRSLVTRLLAGPASGVVAPSPDLGEALARASRPNIAHAHEQLSCLVFRCGGCRGWKRTDDVRRTGRDRGPVRSVRSGAARRGPRDAVTPARRQRTTADTLATGLLPGRTDRALRRHASSCAPTPSSCGSARPPTAPGPGLVAGSASARRGSGPSSTPSGAMHRGHARRRRAPQVRPRCPRRRWPRFSASRPATSSACCGRAGGQSRPGAHALHGRARRTSSRIRSSRPACARRWRVVRSPPPIDAAKLVREARRRRQVGAAEGSSRCSAGSPRLPPPSGRPPRRGGARPLGRPGTPATLGRDRRSSSSYDDLVTVAGTHHLDTSPWPCEERPAGTSAHQGSRVLRSSAVTLIVACTPVTSSISTPRCSSATPDRPLHGPARGPAARVRRFDAWPDPVIVSAPEVVCLAPRGVHGRHGDRAHRHAPIPPDDAPARAPDPAAARTGTNAASRAHAVARACLHAPVVHDHPGALPSSAAADKPSRAVSVVEVATTMDAIAPGEGAWSAVLAPRRARPPRTLRLVTTHTCAARVACDHRPWPPNVADGGRARRQPPTIP